MFKNGPPERKSCLNVNFLCYSTLQVTKEFLISMAKLFNLKKGILWLHSYLALLFIFISLKLQKATTGNKRYPVNLM